MLRATGSPQRPLARPSNIAQRLHEAQTIDSQYNEIENARAELERARSNRTLPPPPAPSPRSRTLNRLLTVFESELNTNTDVDESTAGLMVEKLKEAIKIVKTENNKSDGTVANGQKLLDSNTMRPNNAGVNQQKNSRIEAGGNEDETRLALRTINNRSQHWALVRPIPPPMGGRSWNITITSASLQFNKAVEYEIRAELTLVGDNNMEMSTATCVVRRRYRDFDQLYKMFEHEIDEKDFVLIPSLPPKNAKSVFLGGRADPRFVWERRVALFFWLRYMSEHHVIRNSTLLRVFLWEPNRSSVSANPLRAMEDMNPSAEKLLWDKAMLYQERIMEYRFGNSVVALTAMSTHLRNMVVAFQRGAGKAMAVVLADESLTRSLSRASSAFASWAEFEKSAGQNYSFVAKFAEVLPAQDSNWHFLSSQQDHSVAPRTEGMRQSRGEEQNPSSTEEALVSFATERVVAKHHLDGNGPPMNASSSSSSTKNDMDRILVKDQVEIPVTEGASCDVRSLKAFQTLLHMWGDDILPKMEGHLVDPKKASPYYEETKSKSNLLGNRVACEWTELENLKREMIRDGALSMVLNQVRHAQAERRRWMQLQDIIRVQEVEISSLVALGDVTTPTVLSPSQTSHENLHETSSYSSSARSSPFEPTSSEEFRRRSNQTMNNLASINSTNSLSSPPGATVLHHSGDLNNSTTKLDENLDHVQQQFWQHEKEGESKLVSTRFSELTDERDLNPFMSDDDD